MVVQKLWKSDPNFVYVHMEKGGKNKKKTKNPSWKSSKMWLVFCLVGQVTF